MTAANRSVFEVDHPDTQAWKRRRLALMAILVPPSIASVPADLEQQNLEVELEKAGFKSNEPTFFSWLGVTPYLPNEVVMDTFSVIRSLCPDNVVVFDYVLPRRALSAAEKMVFDALSERVARAGEPFRGFFEAGEWVSQLKKLGFRRVESPSTDQINALYFRNRLDGLRVRGRLGGLICAY
jgi:methyltransferase (TIGR00027 family)